MRIRSLRPERQYYDDEAQGIHWRVANVIAIGEATKTIRILLGVGVTRDVEMDGAVTAGMTIGAPAAVRISDNDTCEVLEILGTYWGGNAPLDEAASANEPIFWPVLPRHVHGEPETWWRI